MDALTDWLQPRLTDAPRRPHLIGLAGSVAVGKSTLAHAVAEILTRQHRRVEVVSTDGFLLSNAALEARGLMARKGFPESYDAEALTQFLTSVRAGKPAALPVYSHRTYDILPGEHQWIVGPEVLIIEGVIALQPHLVGDALDTKLYLDASETDIRRWYIERLFQLRAAAHNDPESYFTRFLTLTEAEFLTRIVRIWETVNAPNLHEHIAPTKSHADLVLTKAANHMLTPAI